MASTISGTLRPGMAVGYQPVRACSLTTQAQAMVISGNQGDQGGGLWSSLNNETTTLSKVTITGNTATGADGTNCANSCGGGVFAAGPGAATSLLAMHFSRLAGNTAAAEAI